MKTTEIVFFFSNAINLPISFRIFLFSECLKIQKLFLKFWYSVSPMESYKWIVLFVCKCNIWLCSLLAVLLYAFLDLNSKIFMNLFIFNILCCIENAIVISLLVVCLYWLFNGCLSDSASRKIGVERAENVRNWVVSEAIKHLSTYECIVFQLWCGGKVTPC